MIQISVIISTYNRAGRLKSCLNALAHQTQSTDDFEVILVNDGGTDDTEAMLSSLDVPYVLRVIYQKNQGMLWRRPSNKKQGSLSSTRVVAELTSEQPDLEMELHFTLESSDRHKAAFVAVDIGGLTDVPIVQALPT